jgi:hypothetical protein
MHSSPQLIVFCPVKGSFGFIAIKIICISNLSILSVLDEGDSNNAPCALNMTSKFFYFLTVG